jgi:hypothetical protein
MYQRYRECVFNAQQFLTSMPTAVSAYDSASILPAAIAQSMPMQIVLPDADQADSVLA